MQMGGIIEHSIQDFSRLQLSNAPLNEEYRKRYPCPPFRICILDEADALSQDAQSALRRVMEIHSANTRFTLICNYVSRIIEPIASRYVALPHLPSSIDHRQYSPFLLRCSKFRFKALAGADAGARLKEIAGKENVKYENGVIEKLLEVSEGDMRRAVTYLQSSFNLTSAASSVSTKGNRAKKIVTDDSDEDMTEAHTIGTPATVTVRTIEEVAGVIPSSVVNDLLSAMQPTTRGSVYAAVSKQVTDMIADGWSANQVLSQLYNVLVTDETLAPAKKLRIFAIFSEVDSRLVQGVDEHIAALDLSLRVAAVLGEKR